MNVNKNSVAEEIKKFKELLDIGAITQEEFDESKKKLIFGDNDEQEMSLNQEIYSEEITIDEEVFNDSIIISNSKAIIIIIIIISLFLALIAVVISTETNFPQDNSYNAITSNIETQNKETEVLYLSDEVVVDNEYCIKYNLNGNEKLVYKIPTGKYRVEVIKNNPMIQYDIFVEYDKIIKNSFGYDEQEVMLLIDLKESQAEITDYSKYYKTNNIADIVVSSYTKDNIVFEVTDELHIFLAIDTNIKLTKLD